MSLKTLFKSINKVFGISLIEDWLFKRISSSEDFTLFLTNKNPLCDDINISGIWFDS